MYIYSVYYNIILNMIFYLNKQILKFKKNKIFGITKIHIRYICDIIFKNICEYTEYYQYLL